MQKYLKNLFLIALLIVCGSCYQDVIDLDLSEHQSQIVIEGVVSDRLGQTVVKISKTSNLFESDTINTVENAVVNISDNNGNSETLTKISDGTYLAYNIHGTPGMTYFLSVLVDGNEYYAVSKFPEPIFLDSVQVIRIHPTYPVFNLVSYFDNPAGQKDYCLIKFYSNGFFLWRDQILFSDRFSDGQQIVVDNLDFGFFLNDMAKIEVLTFDKTFYDFYSVLLAVSNIEDDEEPVLLDLASANPPSNISNDALGYFSAQSFRVYNIRIRE